MTTVASDRRPDANCPEHWVERHGDYLFRYALHRVSDTTLAEEMVQETLLAALESVEGFDGRSEFRTWLTSILRHKIADHFRRRKSETAGRDSTPLDGWSEEVFKRRGTWRRSPKRWGALPEDDEEQSELGQVLHGCLDRLPPQLAELFVLYEQRSVPGPRLASEVGITTGNLWVRLYRARLALRECLEKRWFRPESS